MCEHCGTPLGRDKKGRVKRFCNRSCVGFWRQAKVRALPKPEPVLSAVCGCGCGEPMPEYDHGRKRKYLYRHNPKTRVAKPCPTCGKLFRQRGSNDFCSRACSARSRVVAKVDLICLACGNDYQVFPYRARASKYCSKACWSHRKPAAVCLACSVEFTPASGSKGMYCSRACSHRHMVGERAAQWKGGATLTNERARRSSELRNWRLAVYERDGFRCQDCGGKEELHAHHIKYWSTHPELRFELSNGRTLCIDCHSKVHGRNLRKFRRRTLPTQHRSPEQLVLLQSSSSAG